jgi:hypothetical protein
VAAVLAALLSVPAAGATACGVADVDDEPNDRRHQALTLAPGGASGFVRDDPDVYRLLFDTGPDLTLTLDFVDADGDLDLALYDAAGNLVQTADGAADDETLVAEDLPHGRYYAEVYGFDGASNTYELGGNVAAWPAAQWDVGFVVGDAVAPAAADEAIANRLTFDLSSDVTLVDDDDTESYGAFDLIVISSSTDEGTVGGKYDENADVPVLNLQRLTWAGEHSWVADVGEWLPR